MKGVYRVIIQNKKIKYDFTIHRNITVIRGDSATGKTTLVEMVREYYMEGEDSGIELRCNKPCVVLEGKEWETQLSTIKDSIVFIDEGNRFTSSKEFASFIQSTDNYYVIITRERLAVLPYSVNEIYGIRNSGKYGNLKQTYNEMYHIYNTDDIDEKLIPDLVITEDSNAGHQFFAHLCDGKLLGCVSAEGKSNILRVIEKYRDCKLLVVADGAAFGPEMERVMFFSKLYGNIILYLPESFEWIILNADLFRDGEIEKILNAPSDYISSEEFFSWERFFTRLLIDKTDGTYLKYTKNEINSSYLQENVKNKILNEMKNINYIWNEE